MMIDVTTWPINGPNFRYFYIRNWTLLKMDGRLWMVRPIRDPMRELFDELRTPQV